MTSITLENKIQFKKNVSRMDIPTYGHVWISHSMACVFGIANETFSNQNKKYLIDRFVNRIGILQGAYVFNGVSFLSSYLNNFF